MPLRDVSDVKVIVDHRELKGGVVEELFKLKVQLDVRQLEVADYIVSDRVGFELKNAGDFEASIIDGRLFKQCESLIDSFSRPVLLIVGDLFSGRVHPNAVRGAIASVTSDYGVPVVTVDSVVEAARLIVAYARREQGSPDRSVRYSVKRKSMSDSQFMEAVIASLPRIGVKVARDLLNHFGSVINVMNADVSELIKVKGVGPARAELIKRIINGRYA